MLPHLQQKHCPVYPPRGRSWPCKKFDLSHQRSRGELCLMVVRNGASLHHFRPLHGQLHFFLITIPRYRGKSEAVCGTLDYCDVRKHKWWYAIFRSHANVWRFCQFLSDKVWKNPQGCPFINFVRIAGNFKEYRKSKHWKVVLCVEWVPFCFRLHFLHQFSDMTWSRIHLFPVATDKLVSLVVDLSGVVLPLFEGWEWFFCLLYLEGLALLLEPC